MAPNPDRAPPKKPPQKSPSPAPSSSSPSSSSDDDSDTQSPRPTSNPIQSSSEDDQQSTPKPKHPPPTKDQPAESDSNSDDDTDSDSPPASEKATSSRQPDTSIKPIISKPKAGSPKSKKLSIPKPKSDSNSGDDTDSDSPPASQKATSSRRPDTSIKPIISKPKAGSPKSKKLSTPKPNSGKVPDSVKPESTITKRKLFERFWSEGDEVKILEGIAEYHRKKGTDPASIVDMDSLHQFMKSFLGSEFGRRQLEDKIRRLKKSFRTLHAKNNGNPSITKPHERARYELSKKIWGRNKPVSDEGEDGGDEGEDAGIPSELGSVKQSSRKSLKRKEPMDDGVSNNGSRRIRNHSKEVDDCSYEYIREAFRQMKNCIFSDMLIEQGLKLADPKKAKKLDREFRELSILELKANLEYITIMRDIISHTLEVLQKSG